MRGMCLFLSFFLPGPAIFLFVTFLSTMVTVSIEFGLASFGLPLWSFTSLVLESLAFLLLWLVAVRSLVTHLATVVASSFELLTYIETLLTIFKTYFPLAVMVSVHSTKVFLEALDGDAMILDLQFVFHDSLLNLVGIHSL